MTLTEFTATRKRDVYERILDSREMPESVRVDGAKLKAARESKSVQLGSTNYSPDMIHFELIYQDHQGQPAILSVAMDAPSRIVYMPVPGWVVENIWQGDVSGSYHFESDALAMVQQLQRQLEPEANAALFGPQAPKRRE